MLVLKLPDSPERFAYMINRWAKKDLIKRVTTDSKHYGILKIVPIYKFDKLNQIAPKIRMISNSQTLNELFWLVVDGYELIVNPDVFNEEKAKPTHDLEKSTDIILKFISSNTMSVRIQPFKILSGLYLMSIIIAMITNSNSRDFQAFKTLIIVSLIFVGLNFTYAIIKSSTDERVVSRGEELGYLTDTNKPSDLDELPDLANIESYSIKESIQLNSVRKVVKTIDKLIHKALPVFSFTYKEYENALRNSHV